VTRAPEFQLLLISDGRGDTESLEQRVQEALSALPDGAAAVQVREKGLATRPLVALCRRLLPVCHTHRARLLVNDRCDVALAAGLDGVHLAQSSLAAVDARALLGPDALIGVSCHDRSELEEAVGHASYATWGPVFQPTSKTSHLKAVGLESLREASALGVPLYALGGIGIDNAPEVRRSGACGLAVIGAGLGAPDVAQAVTALWEAWSNVS
jgi:thiamine-phosphate pyrophosphorylase